MNYFQQFFPKIPAAFTWPVQTDLWEQSDKFIQQRKEITFVYPQKTLPVKCQESCELDCAHCNGEYLKHMQTLDQAKEIEATSYLISGGCDHSGRVPITDYLQEISQLKENHRLNVHTGLSNQDDIPEIGRLADSVSFDFVYDDQTIQQVYGLSVGKERYLQVYQELREYTTVIPHICIGLYGGEIRGELAALKALEKAGLDKLAFIVFIPTTNTKFANKKPPALGGTAELLARARHMFPDIPISLGCMRPKGQYRNYLDALALLAGVDIIVQPTPLAKEIAKAFNWNIHTGEECCSL